LNEASNRNDNEKDPDILDDVKGYEKTKQPDHSSQGNLKQGKFKTPEV